MGEITREEERELWKMSLRHYLGLVKNLHMTVIHATRKIIERLDAMILDLGDLSPYDGQQHDSHGKLPHNFRKKTINDSTPPVRNNHAGRSNKHYDKSK